MKPFLRALAGESLSPPPIWLMRQAGRYLPEYRATREKAGHFLNLCYTPDLAAEVTLQPIRRFRFDAAILFSDILVLPHALGQEVWFEENVGPRLTPVTSATDLDGLSRSRLDEHLAPVLEAVRLIRNDLPEAVALIGFAGAPWTVASYMIEGGSSRDFSVSKKWAYRDPEGFQRLIDLLTESTVDYLSAQAEAGAEALQLFDSWAGVWPESHFHRWCLRPMREIISALRQRHPDVPVIVFPRGVGPLYAAVAADCGASGVSLDTTIPLGWARRELAGVTLQGNLDPFLLLAGGECLHSEIDQIVDQMVGHPFIFNLGHGIDKNTRPEHVAELVERVRAGSP